MDCQKKARQFAEANGWTLIQEKEGFSLCHTGKVYVSHRIGDGELFWGHYYDNLTEEQVSERFIQRINNSRQN